jgi:hypothetical protein
VLYWLGLRIKVENPTTYNLPALRCFWLMNSLTEPVRISRPGLPPYPRRVYSIQYTDTVVRGGRPRFSDRWAGRGTGLTQRLRSLSGPSGPSSLFQVFQALQAFRPISGPSGPPGPSDSLIESKPSPGRPDDH